MKKLSLGFALVIILLAATALSGLAKPQNYDSGFQVQNLSSDTDANITMTFYNRDGSIDLTVNDTIDMGGSNTYFPLDTSGGLPGDVSDNFDGSVVISSNTEIAAIANLGADNFLFGASYNGFSSGSPDIALPLLMKDNYGFDTWISVQNTGTSATDITVTYSDGEVETETDVQPGAAAKFDQTTEGHADGWVGSATIATSDGGSGSIAATVIQEGPTTLFAWSGFSGGSTNPVMPIYQSNNFGFVTGIQVQNLSGSDSHVTVTYTAGVGTTCEETRNVPAGESLSFGLYVHTNFVDPNPGSLVFEDCVEGETFVGSATVTGNSNGVDLAATVNQLNFATDKGSLYGGFDPGSASSSVLAPLVMDRNYGFLTGFTLVNASDSDTIAAGDIDCTFVSSSGGFPDVNASNPSPLGPGESWVMVHQDTGGAFDLPLGDGFVGSGTCTGPTGAELFGIINELNTDPGTFPGDTLFTYEGTNQ